MLWSEMFGLQKEPSMDDIKCYINNPFLNELCSFVEANYSATPKIEYSRCSLAKGWNVKYKKGSKAVCTIYPGDGCFTCLVTLGDKNRMQSDFAVSTSCEYIQKLYKDAKPVNGTTWLMIDVTSLQILNDTKNLIALKLKTK